MRSRHAAIPFLAAVIACLPIASILPSCAGAPASVAVGTEERPEPALTGADAPVTQRPIAGLPPIEGANEYYRVNEERVSLHELGNGIPLIVYRDPTRNLRCVRLIFPAGADGAKRGKAGLEALGLELMARGPSGLKPAEMERLLYRSKASFFVDCSSPDYASYAMVAPSSSFDEAWPAFAGSVLDPALREDDFEAVKIARLRDLASIERSTAGLALSALRPAAFSGHPYAASPEGSAQETSGISLDEVKAWRKGLLEDGRMIIVAVGDFALEALLPRLESSFGTLPRAGRKVARIPRWKGSPMLIADGPEGPAQDAWIIGLLPAPSYGDAGSPPFRLADRILNALFRARIRSDERDSQAAGSFYFDGWGAHFAMIVVDTADPLKAKAWIDQSIQALAEGLSPGLPESPEALAPLTETLASWKAAALSRFYARAGSSQAIAAGLGEAFLYTGRPAEYFLMDERIGRVDALSVEAAAKAWLKPLKASWIVRGGRVLPKDLKGQAWSSPGPED